MASPPDIAPIDAEDRRLSQMIYDDLTQYWNDPSNKVLEEPIRAIIYSIATKIIFWCVAVLFPFIAYTAIGISVALIDRVAYNNYTVFFQRVINTCKEFVNNRVRTLRDASFEVVDSMFDSALAMLESSDSEGELEERSEDDSV